MEASKECPVCLEHKPTSNFGKFSCCMKDVCEPCLVNWFVNLGKNTCPACNTNQENMSQSEYYERLKKHTGRSESKDSFDSRYSIIKIMYKKIIIILRMLKSGQNLTKSIIEKIIELIKECNILMSMGDFEGEPEGYRHAVEHLKGFCTYILENYKHGGSADEIVEMAKQADLKKLSTKKKSRKKSRRKSRRKSRKKSGKNKKR